MNKLIGVRRPNYYDVSQNRSIEPVVVEVEDMSKIEDEIRHMLYEVIPPMSHVVTSWRNKLYVCERVAGPRSEIRRDGSKVMESRPYDKSQVDYHPYQHLTS
jgi:hypothetical protein